MQNTKLTLIPARIALQVMQDLGNEHVHAYCLGEVDVLLDSDETAYVTPCNRLSMTDEVVRLIADYLRPMGIKWMRGWGDGGRQGRVITCNGLVYNEPWLEVLHE
jgi:hypothetical protein